MADAQCIYCMEFKPPSSYLKAEHVLPKSFGGFAEALTLNGVVCDDCNEAFGKTIDRELARGSMDGIDRFTSAASRLRRWRTWAGQPHALIGCRMARSRAFVSRLRPVRMGSWSGCLCLNSAS
jgi:hypothetical protein